MSEGTWRGDSGREDVRSQLRSWCHAARVFRGKAVLVGDTYNFTDPFGKSRSIWCGQVIGWRKALARLVWEARHRDRAGDDDWFASMETFGTMLYLAHAEVEDESNEPFVEMAGRWEQAAAGRRRTVEAATRARVEKGKATAEQVRKGERPVEKRQMRRILRGK